MEIDGFPLIIRRGFYIGIIGLIPFLESRELLIQVHPQSTLTGGIGWRIGFFSQMPHLMILGRLKSRQKLIAEGQLRHVPGCKFWTCLITGVLSGKDKLVDLGCPSLVHLILGYGMTVGPSYCSQNPSGMGNVNPILYTLNTTHTVYIMNICRPVQLRVSAACDDMTI